MNNPFGSFRKTINNNLFILRIALKAAPAYVVKKLLNMMKHRILVFLEHVYMIGYIINAIINEDPFWHVAVFIISMFVLIVLAANLLDAVFRSKIDPDGQQRVARAINEKLFEKASETDLKCYDDPKYYTDFVWAMNEAGLRTEKVLTHVSNFIGNTVGLLVVGGYVIANDVLGIIIASVSFVGMFICSLLRNKYMLKLSERMKPLERRRDYTSRVMYLVDFAKELRLNNMKPGLYAGYDRAIDGLTREADNGTRMIVFLDFMRDFVFNIFTIEGVYITHLLYSSIVLKAFAYGTLVTLYNSVNQMRSCFNGIAFSLSDMQEDSLYIDKIRAFLDYKITVKSPTDPVPIPRDTTLRVENLTFGYVGTETLRGIYLTVKPGEKIALVGYNGAGKTTLIKLLMRLYDPSAGRITLGGVDIREFDIDEYHRLFKTVFQDYQLFGATVGENVIMSTAEPDEKSVSEAMKLSGFTPVFAGLKEGFSTQVTREFDSDGLLMSGGQAQSLAITRALYGESKLLILDEPSSALDPLAEYNLNKTMLGITGKTVVIISHRLSTTKMVDKIYMLGDGEILESGSHDELMALGGKYTDMYTIQAERYRA